MKLKSINILEETKNYFSSSLTDFYLDMMRDMETEAWAGHMAELGQQLAIIEDVKSMSDLIRKIDSEELVTPCAIVGEDEVLDETLDIIIMTYMNTHYTPKDTVVLQKY